MQEKGFLFAEEILIVLYAVMKKHRTVINLMNLLEYKNFGRYKYFLS